jgi:hypothetical protein
VKFRKKPIVIEAEQFFREKLPWPNGVKGEDYFCPMLRYPLIGNSTSWITTLEGDLDVSEGDWIITGVKGEKYPCKPDIFEATYEKVEEDS